MEHIYQWPHDVITRGAAAFPVGVGAALFVCRGGHIIVTLLVDWRFGGAVDSAMATPACLVTTLLM
jgi:hypothetical protein